MIIFAFILAGVEAGNREPFHQGVEGQQGHTHMHKVDGPRVKVKKNVLWPTGGQHRDSQWFIQEHQSLTHRAASGSSKVNM